MKSVEQVVNMISDIEKGIEILQNVRDNSEGEEKDKAILCIMHESGKLVACKEILGIK